MIRALALGLAFGIGWGGVAGSGIHQPARGAFVLVTLVALWCAYRAGLRRAGGASANATAVAVSSSESSAQASQSLSVVVNVPEARYKRRDDLPDQILFSPDYSLSPLYAPALEESQIIALAPDLDPEEALEIYYGSGDGEEALRVRAEELPGRD